MTTGSPAGPPERAPLSAAHAARRLATGAGRRLLAATVLASGAVFLEGAVVAVAVPAIGRTFGLGMDGLQWVLNAYMLTLTALLLPGGSLGDVYPRRPTLVVSLAAFAAASALAGIAPSLTVLLFARVFQGAAAAVLVPNSLAVLESGFAEADRSPAIGRWAAWTALPAAVGPLAGGWVADAFSWRWIYAAVAAWALATAWLCHRWIPARVTDAPPATLRPAAGGRRIDYRGALLATVGLAGVTAALVAGPASTAGRPGIWVGGVAGVLALALFLRVEASSPDPLLPFSLFRSWQFSGANLVTLLIYAALGGLFFLLVLQLENVLGYSAASAGLALLPVTLLMLFISPLAGRLAARLGPRLPTAAGALACATGMLLLTGIQPGHASLYRVLPRVAVFGLGLALLVAPLTAAVLAAVPDADSGMGAAVNSATARLASLLATAALPLAAGIGGLSRLRGPALAAGFTRTMELGAALCVAAAAVALLTFRGRATGGVVAVAPVPAQGCFTPACAPAPPSVTTTPVAV